MLRYLASIERDIQSEPLLQRQGEFCFYSQVFSFDKMHLNVQSACQKKEKKMEGHDIVKEPLMVCEEAKLFQQSV